MVNITLTDLGEKLMSDYFDRVRETTKALRDTLDEHFIESMKKPQRVSDEEFNKIIKSAVAESQTVVMSFFTDFGKRNQTNEESKSTQFQSGYYIDPLPFTNIWEPSKEELDCASYSAVAAKSIHFPIGCQSNELAEWLEHGGFHRERFLQKPDLQSVLARRFNQSFIRRVPTQLGSLPPMKLRDQPGVFSGKMATPEEYSSTLKHLSKIYKEHCKSSTPKNWPRVDDHGNYIFTKDTMPTVQFLSELKETTHICCIYERNETFDQFDSTKLLYRDISHLSVQKNDMVCFSRRPQTVKQKPNETPAFFHEWQHLEKGQSLPHPGRESCIYVLPDGKMFRCDGDHYVYIMSGKTSWMEVGTPSDLPVKRSCDVVSVHSTKCIFVWDEEDQRYKHVAWKVRQKPIFLINSVVRNIVGDQSENCSTPASSENAGSINQGEKEMQQIDMAAIASISGVNKVQDDLTAILGTNVDYTGSEVLTIVKESLEREAEEKKTAAAKSLVNLLNRTSALLNARVTDLRNIRKHEAEVHSVIRAVDRARAYALETNNFMPLAALVHDNSLTDKVPEDWKPKAAVKNKNTK